MESDIVEEQDSMGGDVNSLDPTKMEDFSKRQATLIIPKEGGFVPYMQAIVGYDENNSQQFVSSWKDMRVTINGITFHVNEKAIVMATSLEITSRKW